MRTPILGIIGDKRYIKRYINIYMPQNIFIRVTHM